MCSMQSKEGEVNVLKLLEGNWGGNQVMEKEKTSVKSAECCHGNLEDP